MPRCFMVGLLLSKSPRGRHLHGHIASNPALHRNLPFFLQEIEGADRGGRLFVSSAEDDDDAPAAFRQGMFWIFGEQ